MWLDRAARGGLSGFGEMPSKTDTWLPKTIRVLRETLRNIDTTPYTLHDVPPAFDAPRIEASARGIVKRDVLYFLRVIRETPTQHLLTVAAASLEIWPQLDGFTKLYNPKVVFTPREHRRVEKIQSAFPYPCAPMELRAQVVLGQSPRELSYDVLTSKEAHLWLSCYPDGKFEEEPIVWLLATQLGIPKDEQPPDHSPIFHLEEEPGRRPRGVQWFIDVWKDPVRRAALLRPRVVFGPAGEIHGRLYDRIDELEPVDLVRSVERTFRNAVERLVREQAPFEPDVKLIETPGWWIETPYAKLLTTPRELTVEGAEMGHCAGLYAKRVADKESLVISLRCKRARSTVELDPHTRVVRQHVGYGNVRPHPDCEKILETLQRAWSAP